MSESKKCIPIEHENLMSGGWACCTCHTYNGGHRSECKWCNHTRCSYPEVIIESTEYESELPDLIDFNKEIDKSKLN